jgi:signal transduction histidine kinase
VLSYFAAGFLPLLLLGIWSIINLNNLNIKTMSAFYNAQLFQINNNINTLLLSVKQDVESFSADKTLASVSYHTFTNFLEADEKTFKYQFSSQEQLIINKFLSYKQAHPYVNSVYIGFINGAFVRSEIRPRPTKYDPRVRIWYKLAAENPGKTMQTQPYLSLTSDDVNIAMAKTIYFNSELRGVFGIDLTLDRISNFVHNIKLLKGSYIMLADSSGMILTNPDKTKLFKHISILNGKTISKIMENREGFLKIPMDKIPSYIFYYTSPELGWKICAVVPVRTAQEQSLNILFGMGLSIIILAILCLLASYYMADKLSNPFNRLINDMRGLSEKIKNRGNIDKIDIRGDEEVQNLAKAFNNMGKNLSDAYKELDSNFKRVTELDKLKSAFVSMISHELRTPLTIIKGSSLLLKKSMDTPINKKQSELLEMIVNSANKFQIIIEDLLDITKIESGVFSVKKTLCNISSAADESINNVFEPARQKNIMLIKNYNDELFWQADVFRLGRIFSNLLNNAIKFSPENSGVNLEIEILPGSMTGFPDYLKNTIKPDEEYLKISVTDNGPGIQDIYKDKIFDKFFQVEDILTRKHQGAGIGLSIAKGLSEAHGGFIWVVSDGVDKGSKFCVILPKI